MNIALAVVVLLEFAGLVTLGVLLIVSRRHLASARRELRRHRRDETGTLRQGRRKPRGVAPLAVKTVVHTLQGADSLIRHGIVGTVRSSVEDLAGWARVERPDLASITADGRVVLVFSDIEGSTARNESLGDRAWVKILERHNDLVERRVADHRGYVVKNQGDGFMIAFAAPDDAVRCSISIQQALLDNADRYDGIRVRIGAHVGSSVRRGDDLFGRNVAMAARIADLAAGGEILVSSELHESLDDSKGVTFHPPVEVELKGLRGTQSVYSVDVAGAR
ncbi:adenylate/guanylate cyclase domain-containing protein [Mycolicibacterium sp. CR10]|uniref:adenylate/guanylate cyclase domain-containing protein n=1 Tax=Mycolicibacterium sp. CR10 TaxID=2562314 RepID=UPI0010C0EC81|nr:adenylate/guanylate cyclase domain-containing protein [Mycolicibacterium sp. CR10]